MAGSKNGGPWGRRAYAIMGDAKWPPGAEDRATQERMIAWAERWGLRYSAYGRCLHWLTRGQCTRVRNDLCTTGLPYLPWVDFTTGWTRDRKPALLFAQPCCVRGDEIDMGAIQKQWAIRIRVTINGGGWYGPEVAAVFMTLSDWMP